MGQNSTASAQPESAMVVKLIEFQLPDTDMFPNILSTLLTVDGSLAFTGLGCISDKTSFIARRAC